MLRLLKLPYINGNSHDWNQFEKPDILIFTPSGFAKKTVGGGM